ncbi:LytR cell envelope-related transcriptional attenuator [Kytococcus aerolatus]|uniref:LytR cell envelope-related transcriptional attenuator n=1 Tax=Kytococcus aerolatus TaxID=592308 RepID=A0A212THU8_9MICO|nr:LytR C-terminal domain-containing protein [Kytococcus aerolatus]SNC65628.1 LytR cell envelope-related transcriptional attenuator [Kytococcus aerolatus]
MRHRLPAQLAALACAAGLALTACSEPEPEARFPQTPVPGHCADWGELRELDHSTVQVRVLNKGAGAGAAAEAARELEGRGFTVLTTGNDHSDSPQADAIVRYGPMGLSAARTVALQVEGARLERDSRRDPSVDLVLGKAFDSLAQQPAAPADQVRMNVYNTTAEPGLADRAARQMRKRDFTVRKVGNDPERKWYPEDTAIIRHGLRSEPVARTVAAQVPGARLVNDDRTGLSVDLVLGGKYTWATKDFTEPEKVPETKQGPRIGCEA